MFKAAFFDIDGTLVSFKTHEVPESTCRAIAKLRAAGVKCFVSSGRHTANIDNLGSLEFDGYVTVNGGMTYYEDRLIDANPIDRADVRAILRILYPAPGTEPAVFRPFPINFVLRDRLVMNYADDVVEETYRQLNFVNRPQVADLRQFADADVFQMISFFGVDDEPRVMSVLSHCGSERWSPAFTDIVPRGQDKVRGIRRVCEEIGASPGEILAFGDGGNDVAMLRFAGVGVAMGNASDAVKAHADMVCPAVDDDGILWAVDKLLADK